MANVLWRTGLSVAGILLLTSCALEASPQEQALIDAREAELEEQAAAEEAEAAAEQPPYSDEAALSEGEEVEHLRCEDEQALEAKAAHNGGEEPVGWPQEWDGAGPMPEPLCHPDYLEIGEWEDYEAHFACWEGIETSTMVRQGQSDDEVNEFLWEQSQARADWEPNPPGGTCAEQWAEHEGGSPEDYADIGNADDGAL